jgi:hypothetical protein
MDPVKNFGKATLSAGIDGSATALTLVSGGSLFPDPAVDGAFNFVIWNATDYSDPSDDPLVEICRCTARSGNAFTAIARAQEGTSASAHNIAGKSYKVVLPFTKKAYDDIVVAIPTYVKDVLDGPTAYKRVSIPGVSASSDVVPVWGLNDDANPANPYSTPLGSLFIAEQGSGYVDVRSNAIEEVNRRIVVIVLKK